MSRSPQELVAIMDRHLVQLREHFSSVQIVGVTMHDEEDHSTSMMSRGLGSWYERFGAMREVILREDAKILSGEEDDD